VTHDVDEALSLADRVLMLENGKIAHDLTVELPRPRRHDAAPFIAMREALLTALGVSH
jgi:sulfonate transport system ATP-binding protein